MKIDDSMIRVALDSGFSDSAKNLPESSNHRIIESSNQLREAGIESPMLDARLLLSHSLNIPMEKVIFGDFLLDEPQLAEYQNLIQRRINREPISHIIGTREFYGRPFKVTKDTLDPRPDSETLIDAALELFTQHCHPRAGGDLYSRDPEIRNKASRHVAMDSRLRGNDTPDKLKILDLGTGSGCLLLTLLMEFPCSTGFAVDISPAALIIAHENSLNHGLGKRAKFISGCWGESLNEKFDLIISNPPYIKKTDLETLQPEVAIYEPALALFGGDDGLLCYHQLMPDAARLLGKSGILLLEIGAGQAFDVKKIAEANGLSFSFSKKDLAGLERCLAFKNN